MRKYLDRHKAGITLTSDGATNLALLIVKSGVDDKDIDFLKSSWCADLLDFLGVKITGPDLLKMRERYEHDLVVLNRCKNDSSET